MPLKSALYVCLAGLCILVASCRQDNRPLRDEAKDDSEAKAMLQGIWVDSESEDVVFKVSGDSVYYPDATSLPSFFRIKADTLIIGNPPSHYPIMKQMPNVFWFRNQTGDVVKLRKSDDPNVALAFFHNPFPSSISGIPGHDIEDVRLENIEIVCPGRASKGMAYLPLSRLEDVPENEKGYPEFTMFEELPSWGFYVRHVDGIQMKDIKLRLEADDFRPAFVFDRVNRLSLTEINLPADKRNNQVVLRKTTWLDAGDVPEGWIYEVE